jgi:nuclear GTP-binding protein
MAQHTTHNRTPPHPTSQGGIPDLESAARSVLQDWNSGRIPFYTMPPAAGLAVTSHLSTSIVSSWSKEFEMDDIVRTEGKEVLASISGRSEIPHRMLAMTASAPGTVDMEMTSLPAAYQESA